MQPGEVRAAEAHDAAANMLGISEQDRQELLPSGMQPIYRNRAGWAHDRLKRAGLSQSPHRGYWQLTDEGRKFALAHSSPLSPAEVEQLANGFMGVRLSPSPADAPMAPGSQTPLIDQNASVASPEERLGQAVAELRRSVADELLEVLARVTPRFFEFIVLDLLHRMGYGANRSDLQHVGGSGDRGIDGIISLDRLGLEKVYVQAKRWQGVVGRPEIQAFYGALAGQRAHKGVFISTSTYTPQAKEFANSVQYIVLVDGARLAELMIDYEVGVSARTVKVPKLDSDYFDEESA